jgi:hypothetical protein
MLEEASRSALSISYIYDLFRSSNIERDLTRNYFLGPVAGEEATL